MIFFVTEIILLQIIFVLFSTFINLWVTRGHRNLFLLIYYNNVMKKTIVNDSRKMNIPKCSVEIMVSSLRKLLAHELN